MKRLLLLRGGDDRDQVVARPSMRTAGSRCCFVVAVEGTAEEEAAEGGGFGEPGLVADGEEEKERLRGG